VIPLDFLRSLSNQFLPDTAVIQRATITHTGDGTSTTWATSSTTTCRVSPLASSAMEGVAASAAIQANAQWTIWLPALTDVEVTDRIVVNGRTFEVARVGERSYETARECICRELL
jgi:head-tail adaptor